MAQIGEPQRTILVEPLEIPVPQREQTPAKETPAPLPVPETVPA